MIASQVLFDRPLITSGGVLVTRLLLFIIMLQLYVPRAYGQELTIESFCCVRPFTIGSDSVVLVGTVRNTGKTILAANSANIRIYALAGLDYSEGDTAPQLPELAPDAVATFKWKLVPNRADGALIASLAVEQPGKLPAVKIAAIPRVASPSTSESAETPKAAQAWISRGRGEAVIENARLRARIIRAEAGVPILLVSCRNSVGWKQVGVSVPLAEVYSAEGGQRPWWEQFKLEEFAAVSSPDAATLSLSGTFGLRWRGTLDLTLRTESAVLDARMRIASNRPMRVSGIRFCPLLAGSPGFPTPPVETLGPAESGPNLVSAARWAEFTVGVLRPGVPPVNGWEASPLAQPLEAEFRLFGAELRGKESAAFVAPGALLELKSRLFCLSPSQTVRDAYKVSFPTMASYGGGSFRKVTSSPMR